MNREKIVKRVLASVMMIGVTVIATGNIFAGDIVSTPNNELSIGGRMQMLGVVEALEDTLNAAPKDDERLTFFQKQARLNLKGKYDSTQYYVELVLGGEEVPKSNSVLSLLDYYIDTPLFGDRYAIKVGQFKIPYSRERLTSPAILNNADRSIQNLAFNFGRDVGFAVYGNHGNATGAIGIFTAGGMDVPQRYLPEDLGFPLIVIRAGLNNKLDKDVFTPYEVERTDNEGTRYAGYINGFYTKDSIIGHSTALGIKYADKSLFLDSGWNPYVSKTQQAEFYQVGADFAVEMPIGGKVFSSVVEVNYGEYKNDLGKINIAGGMLKGSVTINKFEIGLRYSAIVPDEGFAFTDAKGKTYPIVNSDIIQEIAPSVVFNINKSMKIVMDVPIGIDSPVVIEKGLGAYDLLKHPGLTSYVDPAKGIVERQTTYTGRAMFQFIF